MTSISEQPPRALQARYPPASPSLLFCAWCGPIFLVVFFIGLAIAGLLPPPSPGLSAHEFVHQLISNRTQFRIGLLLGLIAAPLYAFTCAGVTVQLKRIEGPRSPMAYAQLGLGVLAILEILFPFFFLLGAVYHTHRSDTLVQLMADVALLPFVGAWMTVVFQWLATAIAILRDPRENPIFPRWAGYLNLWVAIASLPSTMLQFVHSGPFAWNGIFSFWFAAAAFGIWIIAMSALLHRTAHDNAPETATSPSDSL